MDSIDKYKIVKVEYTHTHTFIMLAIAFFMCILIGYRIRDNLKVDVIEHIIYLEYRYMPPIPEPDKFTVKINDQMSCIKTKENGEIKSTCYMTTQGRNGT